jgi:aryl-alcohol dehydrogenase-like predicted oxidoreductase
MTHSPPGTPPTAAFLPSPSSRALAGRAVMPIAFGCMNLSHAYAAPPSAEHARRLLHAALDAGMQVFDTAALYGFGTNESLVGPVLAAHRDRIVLCSKGGMAGVTFPDGVVRRVIDGRPEAVRRDCEASLQRLGTDHIDLYYLHRWDKAVPIEDSVGEMARLKAEGKIGALGLSEVSAATLRRAHAVHPIAAVQSEYSLWSRNAEIAVLQACAELGAAYVAFSPVARGLLSAQPPDPAALDAKDIRRSMPRFEAAHYPAQLAIAWLLHRAPHVLPLPGTTSLEHLRDNLGALQVRLDAGLVSRLEALWAPGAASGPRYSAQSTREVDTEEYPA